MRPKVLGIVAAVLFLVLLGAYAVVWFIVAGRVEDSVAQWAQSVRAQNIDISWRAMRVGGFPFSFRVEMSEAQIRDAAIVPPVEAQIKSLSGAAHPWNFRAWRLEAPEGLNVTAGPPTAAFAKLTSRAATGSVVVPSDGGAEIWLGLDDPSLDAGLRIAARRAGVWVNLPPQPPRSHTEPMATVALDLHDLTLPVVVPPLRNQLDEIAVGVTLMGLVPAMPPRRAAEAWRNDGGTLELEHFALRWGTLAVNGTGTIALDNDLQPSGAFSGSVAGYSDLMSALVSAGRMRANDARLAGLGLAMLAKPGGDGRPEIATSFTIQNGDMFLGPAKLGKAPRLAW